jgi:hypothetical protein
MTELRLSYYPDITQHRTPDEIRSAIVVFATALREQLSKSTGQQCVFQRFSSPFGAAPPPPKLWPAGRG